MLQLRKTFACFPRQEGEDDEQRRRWTYSRKRLRQRSPEDWLVRLARECDVQVVQQPSLVLSTEMLAFLAQHLSQPPPTTAATTIGSSRGSSNSNKKNTRALQTMQRFLASLPTLRLVEQDRRRSHPCEGLQPSLYPSLITL